MGADTEQLADSSLTRRRRCHGRRLGRPGSGPAPVTTIAWRCWGPFADHTNLALAIHAEREVIHHGAEIALLRDLYAGRS